VVHSRRKLTPFGRRLVVERVDVLGWSAAETARAAGVSRQTVYKWLARFREEGEAGLEDRPSVAHRRPHALAAGRVGEIIALRVSRRVGPHEIADEVGMAQSTVYGVLRRRGFSRLADMDRPSGVPLRYVRDHPGELVHVDTKKVARIPAGGGWWAHGRGRAGPRQRVGYEWVHSMVDDHSRVAYSQIRPGEDAEACARFLLDAAGWFARHGVRIERVMTDRAAAYRSESFQVALDTIGAVHRPTRPYRPQTNGKVERFHKTLMDEWAYARVYTSNAQRHDALEGFLYRYNHQRRHRSLDGQTPMSVLVNNAGGKHT
jgi:transposase InsO family protein